MTEVSCTLCRWASELDERSKYADRRCVHHSETPEARATRQRTKRKRSARQRVTDVERSHAHWQADLRRSTTRIERWVLASYADAIARV